MGEWERDGGGLLTSTEEHHMKMVLTTATLLSTSQHRFLGNRSTPTRVAETLTSIGKAEKCITRSIDRATNRRGP